MSAVNRDLIQRVKSEYVEMPGLALTHRQARRLWNLDPELCDHVLRELVLERFLCESRGGVFLRRGADAR
jgi:hypothetical protein